MKKLIFISLIAVSLFTVSCQKDPGGNADMQTIDFTVQSSQWLEYGTPGTAGYGFAVDLAMPEITDHVLQYGMATLYMKSGDSWLPVPIYFYNSTYQGGFIYVMKRGLFSIEYYESDHLTEQPATQIFRLVIVQPV
jgi:hypothetical protein